MRDIRTIIADNGNDNTPAMDTANLTGRVKCGNCWLPAVKDGLCNGCNRLYEYDSGREFAYND